MYGMSSSKLIYRGKKTPVQFLSSKPLKIEKKNRIKFIKKHLLNLLIQHLDKKKHAKFNVNTKKQNHWIKNPDKIPFKHIKILKA